MAGKSGTARLAHRAGVAIVPMGLWGTHRILTKGRKPHWQWGVAQTAVVGEPIVPLPDEHVKQTTDRMMGAIVDCVARARELYPVPTGRRRRLVVARPRHRGCPSEERVTRVAVVGAGSWGTAVATIVVANAPTMLWAREPATAAHIDTEHENPDYLPGIRLPDALRASADLADVCADARRSSCSRCRRTACAASLPPPGRTSHPSAAVVSLAKGIEQGTLRRMTEVIAEELPEPRRDARRCAHRAQPRAGGRGRPADRVGGRRARRSGRRGAPARRSSRRRCASTRTPTSSAARWPAR